MIVRLWFSYLIICFVNEHENELSGVPRCYLKTYFCEFLLSRFLHVRGNHSRDAKSGNGVLPVIRDRNCDHAAYATKPVAMSLKN